MSRSKRRMPLIGLTCAQSDKPFKIDEHRKERRTSRALLQVTHDPDDRRLHSKVYGDTWNSPKDGKQWVDPKSKWMRK